MKLLFFTPKAIWSCQWGKSYVFVFWLWKYETICQKIQANEGIIKHTDVTSIENNDFVGQHWLSCDKLFVWGKAVSSKQWHVTKHSENTKHRSTHLCGSTTSTDRVCCSIINSSVIIWVSNRSLTNTSQNHTVKNYLFWNMMLHVSGGWNEYMREVLRAIFQDEIVNTHFSNFG